MILCIILPWHKLKMGKHFSKDRKKVSCSCGKLYAMNYKLKSFLPWDCDFFEELDNSFKLRGK